MCWLRFTKKDFRAKNLEFSHMIRNFCGDVVPSGDITVEVRARFLRAYVPNLGISSKARKTI